uniref:Uncharacterized protein n=1 Tax=Timema tahoe TaxID=61484 RepID=A0A7R9IAJ5_9NEOP|nr:unnamed protein product [Timema tahoe]
MISLSSAVQSIRNLNITFAMQLSYSLHTFKPRPNDVVYKASLSKNICAYVNISVCAVVTILVVRRRLHSLQYDTICATEGSPGVVLVKKDDYVQRFRQDFVTSVQHRNLSGRIELQEPVRLILKIYTFHIMRNVLSDQYHMDSLNACAHQRGTESGSGTRERTREFMAGLSVVIPTRTPTNVCNQLTKQPAERGKTVNDMGRRHSPAFASKCVGFIRPGSGFDLKHTQILCGALGLKRGVLSSMRTNEELLEFKKSSISGLEN